MTDEHPTASATPAPAVPNRQDKQHHQQVSTVHSASAEPVKASIEHKLTTALDPKGLQVVNESKLHQHHAAMRGNTSSETHFYVQVVSAAFEGKKLLERHRLVYKLLEPELQQGVHALRLDLKSETEIQSRDPVLAKAA